MNPECREPLLWLQLLGLPALPLEALLLILVLAGADPGPFPGFERVLAWALGALAPAVLFWRLPPDLWSLLLVQVPLRGRRPEQLRLSALQGALPVRVIAAAGAALLLPLLWQLDAGAGLAWAWSPLSASPRLVVLLVSVPLLALMQWQWHQLVQALWLFTRPTSLVDETLPLTQAQAAESRLNLGVPLLLLPPLAIEQPAARAERTPEPPARQVPEPATEAQAELKTEQEPDPEAEAPAPAEPPAPNEATDEAAAALGKDRSDPDPTESPGTASELNDTGTNGAVAEATTPAEEETATETETEAADEGDANSDDLVVDAGVAVTPEQTTEEDKRANLDP
ncbi:MAG: hypothetical protein RLZZ54_1803 [Cyanobacteriota bacterium]